MLFRSISSILSYIDEASERRQYKHYESSSSSSSDNSSESSTTRNSFQTYGFSSDDSNGGSNYRNIREQVRQQKKKSRKSKNQKDNKESQKLTSDKVCSQALQMIKFLGTLHMKKLDLKYEPRLRIIAFLEWISQLEIAFSSNKYTIKVLQDYSTKNKIHQIKSKLADSLVYTVAYAFMDKAIRTTLETKCTYMRYKKPI